MPLVTNALLLTCLAVGIQSIVVSAFVIETECPIRCQANSVCTRTGSAYACVPRTSTNVTSDWREVVDSWDGDEIEEERGDVEQEEPLRIVGRSEALALCPRLSAATVECIVQCRYQSDCRPGQACCSNGCSQTCISITANHVTKWGSCPLPSGVYDQDEPCSAVPCRRDSQCPGAEKCCRSQRCGLTCRAPCLLWLGAGASSSSSSSSSQGQARLNPWRLSHRCSQRQSSDAINLADVNNANWEYNL